jgi:hypothetical protein
MHFGLSILKLNKCFSNLGPFQVPTWTSESIWNDSWRIRHYSNVPSNNTSSKVLYYGIKVEIFFSTQQCIFCLTIGHKGNSWEPKRQYESTLNLCKCHIWWYSSEGMPYCLLCWQTSFTLNLIAVIYLYVNGPGSIDDAYLVRHWYHCSPSVQLTLRIEN